MTAMSDNELIERLRKRRQAIRIAALPSAMWPLPPLINPDGPEAADALEALTAENAALIHDNARLMAVANEKVAECEIAWAALEPFAAGDPHSITEHHLIDAERAYKTYRRTALAQKDNSASPTPRGAGD